MIQNLLIAEAHHPISGGRKHRCTLRISLGLLVVDFAIQLDRQLRRRAVEIQNEAADWVLPTELHTIELVAPQRGPEQRLGWCHPPPQIARSPLDLGRGATEPVRSALCCHVATPHSQSPPPPKSGEGLGEGARQPTSTQISSPSTFAG